MGKLRVVYKEDFVESADKKRELEYSSATLNHYAHRVVSPVGDSSCHFITKANYPHPEAALIEAISASFAQYFLAPDLSPEPMLLFSHENPGFFGLLSPVVPGLQNLYDLRSKGPLETENLIASGLGAIAALNLLLIEEDVRASNITLRTDNPRLGRLDFDNCNLTLATALTSPTPIKTSVKAGDLEHALRLPSHGHIPAYSFFRDEYELEALGKPLFFAGGSKAIEMMEVDPRFCFDKFKTFLKLIWLTPEHLIAVVSQYTDNPERIHTISTFYQNYFHKILTTLASMASVQKITQTQADALIAQIQQDFHAYNLAHADQPERIINLNQVTNEHLLHTLQSHKKAIASPPASHKRTASPPSIAGLFASAESASPAQETSENYVQQSLPQRRKLSTPSAKSAHSNLSNYSANNPFKK